MAGSTWTSHCPHLPQGEARVLLKTSGPLLTCPHLPWRPSPLPAAATLTSSPLLQHQAEPTQSCPAGSNVAALGAVWTDPVQIQTPPDAARLRAGTYSQPASVYSSTKWPPLPELAEKSVSRRCWLFHPAPACWVGAVSSYRRFSHV